MAIGTKIHIDEETTQKIGRLFSMGYPTGQIASMVKISEVQVVDSLQRDAAHRHSECCNRRRRW